MSGIADLLGPLHDRPSRSRGIPPKIRLAAWPGQQKTVPPKQQSA